MRAITDIGDPRLVKALAHPLRLRILSVLEQREASPSELAEELDAPLGNVAYHVRTLADLGLAKLVRRRARRGAVEHYYRVQGSPQVSDRAWAQVPETVKRAIVGTALEQAAGAAFAAAAEGGFDGDHSRLARRSLALDRDGFAALARALERFEREVEEIEAASAKRLQQDDGGPLTAGVVAMLFEGA